MLTADGFVDAVLTPRAPPGANDRFPTPALFLTRDRENVAVKLLRAVALLPNKNPIGLDFEDFMNPTCDPACMVRKFANAFRGENQWFISESASARRDKKRRSADLFGRESESV
jgi:hypothetical protein